MNFFLAVTAACLSFLGLALQTWSGSVLQKLQHPDSTLHEQIERVDFEPTQLIGAQQSLFIAHLALVFGTVLFTASVAANASPSLTVPVIATITAAAPAGALFLGRSLASWSLDTEMATPLLVPLHVARLSRKIAPPSTNSTTLPAGDHLSADSPKDADSNSEGLENNHTEEDQAESLEEQEALLQSVFEFPDTLVREVMLPRTDVTAISSTMSFEQILEVLVDCGHSRLPVYRQNLDEVIGLFYAKDVLSIVESDGMDNFEIHEFLREPYFVQEDKPIAQLLNEFQEQRMHMAIVVDEFGGNAGLITLEDIIEEIFGDIQDEYDVEPTQIKQGEDSTLRVDARVSIDEIDDYIGPDLPQHRDYESVGGFVMDQLGDVPSPGDKVTWRGLEFEVLDADKKRPITVLIRLVDA